MAIFDEVTINGLVTFGQGLGPVKARGLLLQEGNTAPPALVTGNNNDVELPNLSFGGAMVFYFGTVGSGVDLTGIKPPAGHTVREGMTIALVNLGANAITIVANSSASAVGNRFAGDPVIAAGFGCWFIYTGTVWVPMSPSTD